MSPDRGTAARDADAALATAGELTEGGVEEILFLAEERLLVGKRIVETGRVRVSTTTETAEELVRETLRTRRAEVERVPLGHEVEVAPQIRQEGDVLVVPVVEEILVVERRLVLKEEIRLRFVDTEMAVEHSVERRIQRATVERLPPHEAAAPSPGTVEWTGNTEGTIE